MKSLFLFLLFCTFAFSAQATEALSEKVLIEHATHVGFAPPEHRGVFKWQVLTNGVIQKIDNKNKKTILAKLSLELTTVFAEAINRIKSSELKIPTTPPCMDAPSSSIVVQQDNGESMMIWRRFGCRDSVPLDEMAKKIVETVKGLRTSFSQLEEL